MSTYVVGDIHGCFRSLMALLDKIGFNEQTDILWSTGDLVNRGPQSIEVLSFFHDLKHRVIVLGNHDLHLLSLFHAPSHYPNSGLIDILADKRITPLIEWLHHQPLIHYDKAHHTLLVHAALHPAWTTTQSVALAKEIEALLQDTGQRTDFFANLFGNTPYYWRDDLTGWARLRCISNILVRMRYCSPQGLLNFTCTAPIGQQPQPLVPWFTIDSVRTDEPTILFGHWAALKGEIEQPKLQALDGGCVWGDTLIALRLEDQQRFVVNNAESPNI